MKALSVLAAGLVVATLAGCVSSALHREAGSDHAAGAVELSLAAAADMPRARARADDDAPPLEDSADGRGDDTDEAADDVRPQRAGRLTAGEWRDLDHWEEFRQREGILTHARRWGFDTTQRVPVVVTASGVPVTDARVVLMDKNERPLWEARTDNRGRAELFAGLMLRPQRQPVDLGGASVLVEAGDERVFVALDTAEGEALSIELTAAPRPDEALDLMVMIDVTGSMSDELRYLQVELQNVLERVKSRSHQRLRLRTSVGVYRDHGDLYVVRSFPFSQDARQASRQLASQQAGGGGDFPEAVDEALATAIQDRSWSRSARARLLFLVLDAPPHSGTVHIQRLQEATRIAAQKGVRVIPVVASGSDQSNEGLLRSIAAATGGTYTFVTDHSGIGNAHLEPTTGDYAVELLNDMLVRLISEAVEHVGPVKANDVTRVNESF